MEKLIELLNEYMPNMKREERHNGKEIFTNIHNSSLFICYTERVISKRFGFIQWLVDNDKIDKSKVFSFIDTDDKPYEDILCLLALSDEPISDLVSYLK